MDSRALWYMAPGRAAIRPTGEGDGPCRVLSRASAISRGTERLVFEGRVPETEFTRMRAPRQQGSFPFPVMYGYGTVGTVTEGPDGLLGRDVFCLHPHQSSFRAHPDALHLIPQDIPPDRAALAANMETALNAVWDAEMTPGLRVAVIGGGLVGCLTAYLARTIGSACVTLVDTIGQRGAIATELRVNFATPEELDDHFDVIFHTSATESGICTALRHAATEGTVIEMSWYGDRAVSLPLGGAFHSRRLRLVSSQVGMVAPSRRESHSHAERLRAAIALLSDPALDCLISERIAFEALPETLPRILAANAPGIATIVTHD